MESKIERSKKKYLLTHKISGYWRVDKMTTAALHHTQNKTQAPHSTILSAHCNLVFKFDLSIINTYKQQQTFSFSKGKQYHLDFQQTSFIQ